MTDRCYEIVAIAPLQPAGPCFATPIFKEDKTNVLLFQLISACDLIEGFEKIAEGAEGRLRFANRVETRMVGQTALYSYLSIDESIYVGERHGLSEMLRREFDFHTRRIHLRRTIAGFLSNPDLISTAQAEVDAWRDAWRVQALRDRHRQPREHPFVTVGGLEFPEVAGWPEFGVRTAEATAAFREFAEKGISQTRDTYAKMRSAAEEGNAILEATYTAAAKGASQYNLKVANAARTNVDAMFEFANELLEAKSLSEVAEVSAAHARKQITAMTTQAKELAAIVREVANGTTESSDAEIEKAIQSVLRKRA
jgi:phasin